MNTTSLLIETKSPKSQHAQIFRLPNNNIFVKCRAWPPGLLLCALFIQEVSLFVEVSSISQECIGGETGD